MPFERPATLETNRSYDLHVRTAQVEDREQIHELAQENGLPSEHTEFRWGRFWQDNPALSPDIDEHRVIKGYVAATPGGRVVGYLGSIPLMYAIGDTPIKARTVHSVVVDPAFRRPQRPDQPRTARRLLMPFWQQSDEPDLVDLVLSTTASLAQERNHIALGIDKIPAEQLTHSLVWVHRARPFLAAMAHLRQLPVPSLWTPWAALALRVRNRVLGGSTRPLARGARTGKWSVKVTRGEFGPEFDDFWKELVTVYPRRLLRSRDARSLHWNYSLGASTQAPWVVRLESGGKLRGYAIAQEKNVGKLKRLWIADIQLLDESRDAMRALMRPLVQICEREPFDAIELPGLNPKKRALVEELDPIRRKQVSFRGWYRPSKSLAPSLLQAESWDICGYDGDSSM